MLNAILNDLLTHALETIAIGFVLKSGFDRWLLHKERIATEVTRQLAIQSGINPYEYEQVEDDDEDDDDDDDEPEEQIGAPKYEQPMIQSHQGPYHE